MELSRYALVTLGVPLAGLALAGALNRAVDPYRIFSSDPDAVHANRPALHPNLRMHKAHQVNLLRPDSLVLGTSKAIQGIDMASARLPEGRWYGAAVPLASAAELAATLEHALGNGPVRRALVGLDFLSFNVWARTDGPAAGFDRARLKSVDGRAAAPYRDAIDALFTLDALRASVRALGASGDDGHRVMTGRGGREDAEIRSRLSDGGSRDNARQIEDFFTRAVYLPAPHRRFDFARASSAAAANESSLAAYARLLRLAHAHDVDLRLMISPTHARLLALIDEAGLWTRYEAWKRALVAIGVAVAAEAGREPFPLLDFSTPGPLTAEPFPDAGDADTLMTYWYESIHYSQRTGERVLARVWPPTGGGATGLDRDDPDFGAPLTPATLDARLHAARSGLDAFKRSVPDDVHEVRAAVRGGS